MKWWRRRQVQPLEGEQVDDLPRTVVVGVPWETFLEYFADTWKVGQHMALIGPTDSGKTTFVVPVLKLRKYAMAIDAKGGDSRLALAGFTKVSKIPPDEKVLQALAEKTDPVRLLITFEVKTRADRAKLKKLCREALEWAFDTGGWTIYFDEFQVTADSRMMGLGIHAEEMLVSARDPKRITIVTSYQAPAWVPKASTRQAQWFGVWKTNDVDVVDAIAQKMGRDKRELRRAVRAMPRHHILLGGTNTEDPLILTQAPRLD